MFDVKIDKLQSSFLRTLKYKIIKCNMWNKLIYYNILCYDIHTKNTLKVECVFTTDVKTNLYFDMAMGNTATKPVVPGFDGSEPATR